MDIAQIDIKAGLIWPWLLTAFDDWGRADASCRRLKALIFPMMDAITPEDISNAINLYKQFGIIELYEADGKFFMAIESSKWFSYQTHIRSEKREKDGSRYPSPPSADGEDDSKGDETARECAQVRDDARLVCARPPSPSPSPSLRILKDSLSQTREAENNHIPDVSKKVETEHIGDDAELIEVEELPPILPHSFDDPVEVRSEKSEINPPPTLKEVLQYFASRLSSETLGKKFHGWYASKKWCFDSGKPIPDWRGLADGWIAEDFEKTRKQLQNPARGSPPKAKENLGFEQMVLRESEKREARERAAKGIVN